MFAYVRVCVCVCCIVHMYVRLFVIFFGGSVVVFFLRSLVLRSVFRSVFRGVFRGVFRVVFRAVQRGIFNGFQRHSWTLVNAPSCCSNSTGDYLTAVLCCAHKCFTYVRSKRAGSIIIKPQRQMSRWRLKRKVRGYRSGR